jgi:cytoskeletal protein CcmA (bactofilin family)
MANKETRVLKSNTFEEFRQKSNEVSLHLGDNEQLNASLKDKTFNYDNVSAGSTLFDGLDDNTKSVLFEIKPEETLDNTGGYIILTGSPSVSGFDAGITLTQSGGYSATIVSSSTTKILVKNSTGTFNTSQDLTAGTDTISSSNVARIIAEAYPVGVVRVYVNGTEINQDLNAGGFHVANNSGYINLSNNPTVTDFTEGSTIYQGSNLASATFSGTILSTTSTRILLKNHTGSFNAGTQIKLDGSSPTIAGANHSELFNRDTTRGNVIELNTPASANDDIKIFSMNLIEAVNELQDDVGITENLTTVSGNLVDAINEIEAVFDASTHEITAGSNAFNVTSGTFTIDSSDDIILDADGSDIVLKDGGTQYGTLTNSSGNIVVKSGSTTMLTGNGANATFNNNVTIENDLDVDNNLNVDGSTTLNGTTIDGNLDLNGSVDVSTNATVHGNLDVDGATTLDGTTIDGNLDLNGNVDVSGTSDLHGAVEMNSTLGVDGNFRVGSDKFNVTASSGNTQIDGTLEVDGTAGIDGNLRVGADKFNVTASTGNTQIDGALNVDGNTTLNGTTLDGDLDLNGNADISTNLTVGGVLDIGTLNAKFTNTNNVKLALNELHDELGNAVITGTGTPAAGQSNITNAVNAIDAEIGSTSYIGSSISFALDAAQDYIGTYNNTVSSTITGALNQLHTEVGTLSLDTTATNLTSAVNELHGEINSNDTDIGNLMTLIDGASTVDSSITFTGLAGTNIKSAIQELASEKLDLNTGGTTGALARINAGTDSIQNIISRLNLSGNVVFQNGGTNANKMTFNTGTTLDLSNATLLLPGAASSVNIFGVSFLKVDGNIEDPMGFSVDRDHVTQSNTETVSLQWHENHSETNPARGWQLVGLNDSGNANTADVVTFYNAKELIANNTESGINVTWDSTNQNFDFNVNDPTLTFTGDVAGTGTLTNLGNLSIALTVQPNSVALTTDTTGDYIRTLTGTSNQVTVSGSGTEGRAAVVSIPSDFRMPGTAKVLSTTGASSATTGALTVAGGVGIGEDLYVAGDLYVEGSRTELNVTTLEVEDTLVLAGNNLLSEPSSGGFGIETGPITNPTGVASNVTGAHSIVYNYGTDRWEADGSLILSEATLGTPDIAAAGSSNFELSSSRRLHFNAGTGIGVSATLVGNDIDVEISNTLDGYSGWFLSTQGTNRGNIADDERVDFHGGTALTATYDTTNTNRVIFNHDNVGPGAQTFGQAGTEDGTYVKSLTINNQGHITGVTTDDFDDRYNNFTYTHPTYDGDDISIDTGALSGATVISDLDFNITTDTLGHVVDANGTVSTRTLTLADLGYSGTADANTYVHPNDGGGSIGTALTGATVIDSITVNALGHVTGTSTRDLTLANLGYTGATDANNSTDNVTTNISITQTASTDTVTVNSSDGTDGTIAAASSSNGTNGNAGIMTRAMVHKLNGIATGATATAEPFYTAAIAVGDGGLTQKNFTTTLKNKLDGIAAGATATSEPYYTSAIPEATSSQTGLATSTQITKLDGIAAGATATAAPYYTSAIGVGDGGLTAVNFTTTRRDKLDGIATGATNTAAPYYTSAIGVGDGGLTAVNFTTTRRDKLDGIESGAHNHAIYGYNDGASGYVMSNGLGGSNHIYIIGGSGISVSQASNYNGTGDHGLRISCDVVNTNNYVNAGTYSSGTLNLTGPGLNFNVTGFFQGNTYSNNMNQYVRTTDTVQFGLVRSTGDVVAYYSDDRLKNRIGNIESALDKVNQLNGFTFTPNEESVRLGLDPEGKVRVGVSAQEVQAVLPEAVTDAPINIEHGTDYKTVQYEKMVPLLIEAIKELTEENKQIRLELENLKSINR